MLSEFHWHSGGYNDVKHIQLRLCWHKYFVDEFFTESERRIRCILNRVELFLFGTQEECTLNESQREREIRSIFDDFKMNLGRSFFTYLLKTQHIESYRDALYLPSLHVPFRILKNIIDEKFKTINVERDLEKIIDKNLDIEVVIDSEFRSKIRRYELELNNLLCCKVTRDYFHGRNRRKFFETIIRHRNILLDNTDIPIKDRTHFLCNICIKSSVFLESIIDTCEHDARQFKPRIEPYSTLLLLMSNLESCYYNRVTFNPYPERLAHYEWKCDNVGFKSRRRCLILSLHKRLGLDKKTISMISEKICTFAGFF